MINRAWPCLVRWRWWYWNKFDEVQCKYHQSFRLMNKHAKLERIRNRKATTEASHARLTKCLELKHWFRIAFFEKKMNLCQHLDKPCHCSLIIEWVSVLETWEIKIRWQRWMEGLLLLWNKNVIMLVWLLCATERGFISGNKLGKMKICHGMIFKGIAFSELVKYIIKLKSTCRSTNPVIFKLR